MSRWLAEHLMSRASHAPLVMSGRSPVAQVPEPLAQESSILIRNLLHGKLDLVEEGSLVSSRPSVCLSIEGQMQSFGVPIPSHPWVSFSSRRLVFADLASWTSQW